MAAGWLSKGKACSNPSAAPSTCRAALNYKDVMVAAKTGLQHCCGMPLCMQGMHAGNAQHTSSTGSHPPQATMPIFPG